MNWNKVWDVLINKAHVGIACMWKTGRDLGSGVQQTVSWFYAFLAGHFGASQVWPDKDDHDTPQAPQS